MQEAKHSRNRPVKGPARMTRGTKWRVQRTVDNEGTVEMVSSKSLSHDVERSQLKLIVGKSHSILRVYTEISLTRDGYQVYRLVEKDGAVEATVGRDDEAVPLADPRKVYWMVEFAIMITKDLEAAVQRAGFEAKRAAQIREGWLSVLDENEREQVRVSTRAKIVPEVE